GSGLSARALSLRGRQISPAGGCRSSRAGAERVRYAERSLVLKASFEAFAATDLLGRAAALFDGRVVAKSPHAAQFPGPGSTSGRNDVAIREPFEPSGRVPAVQEGMSL